MYNRPLLWCFCCVTAKVLGPQNTEHWPRSMLCLYQCYPGVQTYCITLSITLHWNAHYFTLAARSPGKIFRALRIRQFQLLLGGTFSPTWFTDSGELMTSDRSQKSRPKENGIDSVLKEQKCKLTCLSFVHLTLKKFVHRAGFQFSNGGICRNVMND